MPTYWSFFVTFFRIGLFTVGGGYVMLPMIEDEVVDKKKWINKGDFLDLLAVAQTVPGVFAVNMSINIGYRLRKVPGALACALGCVLPSFLIILAIALFFHQFENNPTVECVAANLCRNGNMAFPHLSSLHNSLCLRGRIHICALHKTTRLI